MLALCLNNLSVEPTLDIRVLLTGLQNLYMYTCVSLTDSFNESAVWVMLLSTIVCDSTYMELQLFLSFSFLVSPLSPSLPAALPFLCWALSLSFCLSVCLLFAKNTSERWLKGNPAKFSCEGHAGYIHPLASGNGQIWNSIIRSLELKDPAQVIIMSGPEASVDC